MVSCFANRKWHNISHIVSTFDTIGLGYPILSVNIIVILLSVALLVIGVERIASGIVDVVLSSSLQKAKNHRAGGEKLRLLQT
jgi:hypothetical protein